MKLSKRVLSTVKRACEREVATAKRALRLVRKLEATCKGFQTKSKRAAAHGITLVGNSVARLQPAPKASAPSAEAYAKTPTRAGSSSAAASAYGDVAAAVCTSTAAVAAAAAPQQRVNGSVMTITLTGF